MAEAAARLLDDIAVQELANTAWAFATVKQSNDKLLTTLARAAQQRLGEFDAQGLAYQETPFDGRSDYGPFIWTGIPAGGLFTGAEAIKSAGEADAFGGTAFEAFDPCYHKGCDTLENLDLDVLDELAAAAAHSVAQLGMWDGPLSDGAAGPPVDAAERSRLQSDKVPTSCGAGHELWRR